MKTDYDPKILKDFMLKYFDYSSLKKAGLFTIEKKNDYLAQAKRICTFFGYESIYEYRTEETRCHITTGLPPTVNEKGELEYEPFITVIPTIWDDLEDS